MKKTLFSLILGLVLLATSLSVGGCVGGTATKTSPPAAAGTVKGVDQLSNVGSGVAGSQSGGSTTAQTAAQTGIDMISFADMAQKVLPSVVFVSAMGDPDPSGAVVTSAGTGVILRADGYILTNKHVIEGFKSVEVTLNDRRVYMAAGRWEDNLMDLAVIKIDAQNLPTVPFADADTIRVGDRAIAFGHALGLSPFEGGASVTSGIVSNLGRSFKIGAIAYYDVIQTDAAINHGNSGGPLMNSAGELIGINSAGIATADGIGYAINIGSARHIFEDLVKYGKPIHPYLGLTVDDLTRDKAPVVGLSCLCGVTVTSVIRGGPAQSAGLKPGDIIRTLNGNEIESTADLLKYLWRLEVGSTVDLTFWRDGEDHDIRVTLPDRPDGQAI